VLKNALMTSEIYIRNDMSWEVALQRKSWKILVVLDNCASCPLLDYLKNVQLESLSPNITSLVQPMVMGIIKNLKTLYHAKLVNYILEAI
jgi:hypothetical protein